MVTTRKRRRTQSRFAGLFESSEQERADYSASQRSNKLRAKPRGIPAQGASGDWHFRRDSDHLWVGELGREMDRNNPVGKRMLNVIVQNVLQDTGFFYTPDTGNESVDDEIKHWWRERSADPQFIDLQGQHNFNQLSQFVLRDTYSTGDILPVFNQDGPLELREFHRCRQPWRKGIKHKNNVLGVELSEERKRLGYWFTNEPIDPLDSRRITHDDLSFVEAFDVSGDWITPNVLHVRSPDRISQTRGVSMFAPVFDYLGFHDDGQFQQMLRSQLSNMILLMRQRSKEFSEKWINNRLGIGEEEVPAEVDRLIESLYPGAEIKGLPGEEVSAWAPNIPNSEWFDHMRLILRLIGIAWGVPYVLLMLDTADTTFHGYRGAVIEAREMFKGVQRWLSSQWHTPVVTHYLHRLADEDPGFRKLRDRSLREAKQRRAKPFNLFRHEWTYPRWPSVDDLKDASADVLREANGHVGLDKIAEGQDTTVDRLNRRVVDGRFDRSDYAFARAKELLNKHGLETSEQNLIQWALRLGPLSMPENTQLSISLQDSPGVPQAAGGSDG